MKRYSAAGLPLVLRSSVGGDRPTNASCEGAVSPARAAGVKETDDLAVGMAAEPNKPNHLVISMVWAFFAGDYVQGLLL